VRTAEQLVAAAAARREERERAERERRESAAAERARHAELARTKRLAALAAEGEAAWRRVASRVAEKKPPGYDVAVNLLVDLHEVTDPADFACRLEQLRHEHGRKPSLIERLVRAGLS
jgi:predicted alpha/beta-hydrolase family hydrolase